MERLLSLVSICALLASGCGDDATTPDGGGGGRDSGGGGLDGGGTDDSGGGLDAGETVTGSWTVEWGPIMADAFEEDTRCVIKRLGNPGAAHIGRIHNVLGDHSHHMIVYRTSDTEEQLEPFPCTPFVDTLDPAAGAPLTISQRAEELIQLPPGVAFSLEENQMVRLELHYVNLEDRRSEVRASSTFEAITDFVHEADFLFIGNIDVEVPARSTATLGPTFFRVPPEYADVHFFSITGHTHQWGTNVFVGTAESASGPVTAVYDVPGWLWNEPETVYHDPPFQVPAGGGFSFTCEWDNPSDTPASFGESAEDEMCFFWTYYYPSQGPKVCGTSDRFGASACCPGSPACAFLESLF
jgi:hypothetical protein